MFAFGIRKAVAGEWEMRRCSSRAQWSAIELARTQRDSLASSTAMTQAVNCPAAVTIYNGDKPSGTCKVDGWGFPACAPTAQASEVSDPTIRVYGCQASPSYLGT